MGTCYYFGREDNHTLFDMDKAYRIGCQLTTGDVIEGTYAAISRALWHVEKVIGSEETTKLCKAIFAWSDGREIVFLSEHDVEGDEWRCGGDHDDLELRVTGSRMEESEEVLQLIAARKAGGR